MRKKKRIFSYKRVQKEGVSYGRWQCTGQRTKLGEDASPENLKTGEVTVTREKVVSIDGIQTRSYRYTWGVGGSIILRTRLFVGVSDGLPRRSQLLGEKGQVTNQFDYYEMPNHSAGLQVDGMEKASGGYCSPKQNSEFF